jgi:hypothetical protein
MLQPADLPFMEFFTGFPNAGFQSSAVTASQFKKLVAKQ